MADVMRTSLPARSKPLATCCALSSGRYGNPIPALSGGVSQRRLNERPDDRRTDTQDTFPAGITDGQKSPKENPYVEPLCNSMQLRA